MVSGINSLSAGSIPLLFGTSNNAAIDCERNEEPTASVID